VFVQCIKGVMVELSLLHWFSLLSKELVVDVDGWLKWLRQFTLDD
jgi:hypothetical protein